MCFQVNVAYLKEMLQILPLHLSLMLTAVLALSIEGHYLVFTNLPNDSYRVVKVVRKQSSIMCTKCISAWIRNFTTLKAIKTFQQQATIAD